MKSGNLIMPEQYERSSPDYIATTLNQETLVNFHTSDLPSHEWGRALRDATDAAESQYQPETQRTEQEIVATLGGYILALRNDALKLSDSPQHQDDYDLVS